MIQTDTVAHSHGPFSFRAVALVASVVCSALALIWTLSPQLLLRLWQVDRSPPALLMARRAA